MTYDVITDTPEGYALETSPSGYWLIVQFEIVLRYRDDFALILTHPSYVSNSDHSFGNNILCPPFLAYSLSSAELYFDNAGDIRAFFEEQEINIPIERNSRIFLYTLGLTNYKIKQVGQMIELKESNREPGKFKCYKILRYSVSTKTILDIVNLVDPLALSGYSYLPLPMDSPLRYLQRVDKPSRGVTLSYHNIDLSSNLCHILNDPNELAKMIQRYIVIPDKLRFLELDGFLVRLDLANSGRLSKYLIEETDIYFLDNEEIEAVHELGLHNAFLDALIQTGFSQYEMIGDGFVAALSVADNSASSDLAKIFHLLEKIELLLEAINARSTEHMLAYRCAITHGTYRYGRFSFLNNRPYLMGHALIRLARLESGAKKHANKLPRVGTIIFDEPTFRENQDVIVEYFNVITQGLRVQEKETTLDVVICSVRQQDGTQSILHKS